MAFDSAPDWRRRPCWRRRDRFLGIQQTLPGCFIGTSLMADKVLVTLTSFSRLQEDIGYKFLYP